MNSLKGARCYLAGAIENTEDNGASWRERIKRNLAHLEIQWLDPLFKPIEYGREEPGDFAEMKEKRSRSTFSGVREFMRKIRAVDLRMVDISDFLIVHLNPTTPTFGTHEEVARAASQNKPVIVMVEGGVQAAPLWWFDMLNDCRFFSSWNQVHSYLIENSTISKTCLANLSDGEWLLFDWVKKK